MGAEQAKPAERKFVHSAFKVAAGYIEHDSIAERFLLRRPVALTSLFLVEEAERERNPKRLAKAALDYLSRREPEQITKIVAYLVVEKPGQMQDFEDGDSRFFFGKAVKLSLRAAQEELDKTLEEQRRQDLDPDRASILDSTVIFYKNITDYYQTLYDRLFQKEE